MFKGQCFFGTCVFPSKTKVTLKHLGELSLCILSKLVFSIGRSEEQPSGFFMTWNKHILFADFPIAVKRSVFYVPLYECNVAVIR